MKRPIILVVAQSPDLVDTLLPILDPGANDVIVVDSFTGGKQHLMLQPHLLITELRLGEYNGLHLALRAQAYEVPAIVIGDADPVLQRDAASFGASYLTLDEAVAERVQTLLQRTVRLRPRVPATDVSWQVYPGHARPSGTASPWEAVLATRITTSYH